MRKSGSDGLIGGLILWMVILYYVQKWLGWAWLITISSTIIFIIFLLYHFDRIKAKRDQEVRATAPCKHGIVGANQNPRQCSICLRENQEREKEGIQRAAMRKQHAEEQRRQAEEQRRQLQWWKKLDGKQFEKELAILLRQLGYDATLTPYSGDGGVDIIVRADTRHIVVQCKAHNNYISPGVVRELYGTMIHEKADEGWLVVTSGFYSGARLFAHDKPIKLITIKELLNRVPKESTKHNDT